MAVEWPKMTLRQARVALIDCEHRTPPAADAGYPYVGIPQLRGGRVDLSGARRITRAHYVEWTRKAKPSPHDVILSRRCNPGETAVVPPDLEFALGQNLVLLRADGTKVFQPFLRWLVRGPEWWEQIAKFMNVGAVFDSLRCADVPNFELHIPPIPDQRAIAHILATLDDKIELNRRMNETLEAIARAIFKAWFVDFDPVRAKAEGRQPAGMDAETASLFPDHFAEPGSDSIPAGWTVAPFNQVVDIIGGGTPKTSVADYWDGDIPWFSVVDAPSPSDVYVVDTQRTITQTGLEASSASLLPVGTTIISARGTVGKLALVGTPMAMNQSCYALRARDSIGPHSLYFAVRQLVSALQQNTHGTVFDTITRDTFTAIEFVIPPSSVLATFERHVDPLMRRIVNNLHESRTLALMRDTLLPRLLTGDIRATACMEAPDGGFTNGERSRLVI